MYTWGYLRRAALANLDLTDDEANEQGLANYFTIWANEVITQISSTIKPLRTTESVDVYEPFTRWKELSKKYNVYLDKMPTYDDNETYTDDEQAYWNEWNNTVFVNTIYEIKNSDFISFGNNITLVSREYIDACLQKKTINGFASDLDYFYYGYKKLYFRKAGSYTIPINVRWYTFDELLNENEPIDVPNDILECIPTYIAMKGWKIDDEYKSSVFKNEYELQLARIDDEHFEYNDDVTIEGDW